jgi:hypothetical protein
MADLREWFWQLEASGLGPDHFVAVRFLPSQAALLLQLACQFMPFGFVAEGLIEGRQRFTDQRTFDALKSMRESGVVSNIYITSSVEICDANVSIENTYARHEDGETAFLVALIKSESLTVQDWRVLAGGSDYGCVEVARGDSTASFLEYLQG